MGRPRAHGYDVPSVAAVASGRIERSEGGIDIDALIVEDHRLFAEAIRPTLQQLGFEVEIVTTGRAAIEEAEQRSVDVALVDLGLPDINGLDVGARLLEIRPSTLVMALTAMDDEDKVRDALAAGFRGYLSKDLRVSTLSRAIRSVLAGEIVTFARASGGRVPAGTTSERRHVELLVSTLTPREREVLGLLARGWSGAHIARHMAISVNTVRTHVQSVLTKLQVHSRLEAAAFAVRHGFDDDPASLHDEPDRSGGRAG